MAVVGLLANVGGDGVARVNVLLDVQVHERCQPKRKIDRILPVARSQQLRRWDLVLAIEYEPVERIKVYGRRE